MSLTPEQAAEAIVAGGCKPCWTGPHYAPAIDVAGGRLLVGPGDGNAAHGFEAARRMRAKLVEAVRLALLEVMSEWP